LLRNTDIVRITKLGERVVEGLGTKQKRPIMADDILWYLYTPQHATIEQIGLDIKIIDADLHTSLLALQKGGYITIEHTLSDADRAKIRYNALGGYMS